VEGDIEGVLYDILLEGEVVSQTCVTDAQPQQQPQVTPGLVLNAFRRLAWPASPLLIQPVGGRTLVNFATNFYTDNTTPTRQSISLLGQRVTVEATPTTYTWRFGDGQSDATTSPGAAYPTLDVTHDYLTKGRVAPSVDTTYAGRYRVNRGPWIAIPATLTVPGASVAIDVIEARPTLVG